MGEAIRNMAVGALAWAALGWAAPAEAQVWEQVCKEGEVCPLHGTRPIRYGAKGTFHYGVASRSVTCNNKAFGDPTPGVPKTCEAYYTAEERALFDRGAARDRRIAELEEETRTMQAELDAAEGEIERLERALRRAERRSERGGVRLELRPAYRDAR